MYRDDFAVDTRKPGRPMEVHGPRRPTGIHGDRDGPTSTDGQSGEGRIGREVRIVNEIKLERRAKSRVRE